MRVVVGLAGVALAVATMAGVGGAVWASHRPPQLAALRANTTPVIVELFSSEGCSSCPPADAWLSSLDRTQPVEGVTVLALEEHVDYWDRLGWRDPFAQGQFSERQQSYARVLPDRRVFTPEIVVDGRAIVDGDDEEASRALRASAAEPRVKVRLARKDNHLVIEVGDPITSAELADLARAEDPAEIWLAITESNLSSQVVTGENAGRHLAHAPIVRLLRKLGVASPSMPSTSGGSGGNSAFHAELDTGALVAPAWAPAELRFIAFVQRAKSKNILGASAL